MAIEKRQGKRGVVYRVKVFRKGKLLTTKTFDSKAEAEAYDIEMRLKVRRGEYVGEVSDVLNKTFSEVAKMYLDEYVSGLRGKHDPYKSTVKFLCAYFGDMRFSEITPREISGFRDWRLKQGVSNKTVRNNLLVLSSIYRFLQRRKGYYHLRNWVKEVELPSAKASSHVDRVPPDVLEVLLEEAKKYGDGRMYYVIRFAVLTGARAGEIAKLRWSDVSGKSAFLQPSRNGEPRILPLCKAAREVLREVSDRYNRQWGDVVFGYRRSDLITQSFIRIRRRAGVAGVRFHDLRHEAASIFFEKGLNPMQVAAITGHKTLQVLKRYTHLRAEDLADMLD